MRQPPTKKTFNFFDRITVSSGDFGAHFVKWDFISAGLLLLNEGASGTVIEYSFDGVNVHGDLDADTASVGIAFDNRHQDKIYFRLSAGSIANIRIEAWA
jgi:hypothetical protein